MRRYRRLLAVLMAALLAFSAFSGCGKKKQEETPEETQSAEEGIETMRRVADRLESASSVSASINTELRMKYVADGVEATLEMYITQDTQLVREPEAAHTKGVMTLNLSDISLDTETYAVKEGDQYVTYTASGGQWIKGTSEAVSTGADASGILSVLLENSDNLTVYSPIDEYHDLQIVGEGLSGEIFAGFAESAETLLEVSGAGELSATVAVVMEEESEEIIDLAIDLKDSFGTLLEGQKEALGFDEVEVTRFVITMSDFELDTVSEIKVPDEVLSSAIDPNAPAPDESTEAPQESESESQTQPESVDPEEPSSQDYELPQDEAGNYVLGMEWYGDTITVSTPRGFVYNAGSDKTWLQFDSSENDGVHVLSMIYTLYIAGENYSEEDLAQAQESSYAYMNSSSAYSGVAFDPVQTVTAAGKQVSYTRLAYTQDGVSYEEYNSWCVYPDGRMLQCTIKETADGESCNRIDPATVFETAFSAPME